MDSLLSQLLTTITALPPGLEVGLHHTHLICLTTKTAIFSTTRLCRPILDITGRFTMNLHSSLPFPIILLLNIGVPLLTLKWMFRWERHLKSLQAVLL